LKSIQFSPILNERHYLPGSESVRAFAFILVAIAANLAVARADTITTIDFEKIPFGSAGPPLFTDAGGVETIDIAGVASITGGVVLGLAPALSGNPYATGSNIYATASNSVVGAGGFGLPDSIVINIASGTHATQATVPVINGMSQSKDYVVTAFDDGAVVWQQTLSDVQGFGYAVANVTGSEITSIEIAAADSSTWDFATDTITLTESSSRSTVTSTPEPGSAFLLLGGLAIAGAAGSLKRRNPLGGSH
jgi:hypothetical protein